MPPIGGNLNPQSYFSNHYGQQVNGSNQAIQRKFSPENRTREGRVDNFSHVIAAQTEIVNERQSRRAGSSTNKIQDGIIDAETLEKESALEPDRARFQALEQRVQALEQVIAKQQKQNNPEIKIVYADPQQVKAKPNASQQAALSAFELYSLKNPSNPFRSNGMNIDYKA